MHPFGVKVEKNMELIQPMKQKVWGWPAVINFIFGGVAAGFYLLCLLMASLKNNIPGESQLDALKLLAPILTVMGFLALTAEAGRPLRGLYLFRNLHSSWMSRETLAGTLFVLTAAADCFFPHMILRVLAAVSALGLIISQGFIVYCARAVIAWNVPIMPLVFVTSGFALGEGLVLVLASMGKLSLGFGPIVIGLFCVALDLVVWLIYLYWSNDAAFRKATKILRHPIALTLTVGIGHLFPVLLLLLFVAVPGINTEGKFWNRIAALAGLFIVVGGVSQKFGIILWADYLRGIVLGQSKDGAQSVNSPINEGKHLDIKVFL